MHHHSTRMSRQSSWAPGRWLLGILGSLVLGSLPGGAADALGSAPVDAPGEITFQDRQLTARIGAASLWQVMAEVTRLSGAQVRWMDAKVREQAVSVEFRDLALAEAVRRLLRATNFLLVYTSSGEDARLTQIWIASREDGGLPGRQRPPASPGPLPPPADEPAAAIEEPAAAVEVPLETLIQTATDDADLAARLSAIGELGSHAPHEAGVRDLLEDLANHDPNPQVRDAAAMLLGGGR
jgi:hypothetical protein